jgi:hypothetical protein
MGGAVAVPYEVVEPAFIALVAALVLLIVAAPRLAGMGRLYRGPRFRIVTGTALIVVLGGALGLTALGAPLDPANQPLQPGHAFGGNDPRLLAMRGSPRLTGMLQEYDYAYAPGAEVRISFLLLNASKAPLTVFSIEADTGANVSLIQFRLPPILNSDLPAAYPNEYPNESADAWASRPFHSFDIAAGDEVGLVASVTLGECPGTSPVPTLAPSASPLPESDPRLGGGFDVLGVLVVRYVQLGIARTETIVLPFYMHVVTSQTNSNGCPPA